MGRKRKIPKESKSLKYMYFIKVNLHNEDTLKFGISNNVVRRMTEYNNSETVGELKEVFGGGHSAAGPGGQRRAFFGGKPAAFGAPL